MSDDRPLVTIGDVEVARGRSSGVLRPTPTERPDHLRPRGRISRLLAGVVVTVVMLGSGCSDSSGEEDGAPRGGDVPREVVDAHIAAMRSYDLAAACNLLSPLRREAMVAFDGGEVEGYCDRAVADVLELATDEVRDRNRRIYTGPTVTELERPGDTWFRIEAADGSHREDVLLVEVDGRWWVQRLESDVPVEGDGDAEDDTDPPQVGPDDQPG